MNPELFLLLCCLFVIVFGLGIFFGWIIGEYTGKCHVFSKEPNEND